MRKITQTIVGTTPPLDKNVLWLDTTNSNSPVEKVFLNGAWIPTSAAGGDYYTKDEVDENFMGKIDNPHVGNILVMDENGKAADSLKKPTDFISNPEGGQQGEVLSVDGDGNPIWTTITPTGTADTEMSSTSTNAVQNKVIKTYIDNNFARKDGYYSQLTAGSAENLVGQTVDSDAYLIRPTGGAENEVANGVASVLGMEGNSAVWNQLLKQGRLVDMGLPSGLLWATSNIDITQEDGFAASPFQYGCTMFSWGNIEGHNTPASGTTFDYNWGGTNAQEPWYEGQPYGETPGAAFSANIVAGDTQDAARYNLGSLFKMPTSAQFKELFDNCDFVQADGTTVIDASVTDKRVTINGIAGIYLKSKVNGNLIFFSASGYASESLWNNRGSNGIYWSASLYSSRYARCLVFSSSEVTPQNYNSRCIGFAVRAVVNPNTVDTGHNGHGYYVDKDIIVDLTLLNHSNIAPSSTDATVVKEKIAQLVGVKPYYGYNAGTILSSQTLGIKTYGQNLLNPTTRQAKLIPYSWEENSNVYTIKNVPSANDLQITYTPDATGVAVTIYSYDSENPTPIPDSIDVSDYGGSGVLYISSATADTYVCMKWDEQKDDDVVPFEDHTQEFDVRKVYGKVSGAGEYVQCYPNGMRSVGIYKDTLTTSEAVVRINGVNLGTFNWYSNDNWGPNVFFTIIDNLGQKYSNLICSKYVTNGDISVASMPDKSIGANSGAPTTLLIKDTAYSVPSNFKTSMQGVILNYILKAPITYTDLVYRDGGIDRPLSDALMDITVNNWSIEEQLLTPYDEDGNPTAIPATIKTQYGMDAVEAIDTLQKTCYFADDVHANLQALLTCINTNCAETLGGTFSISETATDKVFAFSFTPNAEPDVEPTNVGE